MSPLEPNGKELDLRGLVWAERRTLLMLLGKMYLPQMTVLMVCLVVSGWNGRTAVKATVLKCG